MRTSDGIPEFGDEVRIRVTPLTEKLGLAGLTGSVAGETTPSITHVEVIGTVTQDFALNVMFDGPQEQRWFAPDLVEFVSHGAGNVFTIGDRSVIREADGEWKELPGEQPTLKARFWHWLLRSFIGKR